VILVTGASGFIGSHLVGTLVAEGEEVRALVRSEAGAAKVRAAVAASAAPSGGVDIVTGDVADPASLRRAARGAELVYHLAGTYRGDPDELHATHVVGTKNLLAALDAGTRLVLVSSTSVYGWEQSWPADDATPPRPTSAYGVAKLTAEHMVLGWDGGEGVVARTTIVYGPGDTGGMLPRAVRLLQRGLPRFPGDGRNRIHLTHIDDLTAGLSRLARKGTGVFLFAGPEAASMARILTLLAEGAGLPPPSFGIPSALLRPLAAGVEAVWSLAGRGGEAPLSRHSVEVACRDRAYSPSRAAEELGWSPEIPLDVGIPQTGRWLAGHLTPGADAVRTLPATNGAAVSSPSPELPLPSHGFEWRSYFADADEGLGTVYERFALQKVLESAMAQTGSTSVLHAPLFGMLGVPGLDAVFLAREGTRVGLLDFDDERFDAVRKLWDGYGLTPEIHRMDGADPTTWPEKLPASYDLVFSFAALWWFKDPWAVVAAQARWANKAVLVCVPNRNVFMKLRSLVWHRDQFKTELNEEALDTEALKAAAKGMGLKAIDTGLFDIPPFPDTSVPLAKGIRRILGSRAEGGKDEDGPAITNNAAAWRWSILPYLDGDDPGLAERVEKFTILERHLPAPIAPHLAHHRFVLFVPENQTGPVRV
jgi:nucleoside-diphosphate-sugar epimerase